MYDDGCSWEDIHAALLGRTKGAIQVRYSTKLKNVPVSGEVEELHPPLKSPSCEGGLVVRERYTMIFIARVPIVGVQREKQRMVGSSRGKQENVAIRVPALYGGEYGAEGPALVAQ